MVTHQSLSNCLWADISDDKVAVPCDSLSDLHCLWADISDDKVAIPCDSLSDLYCLWADISDDKVAKSLSLSFSLYHHPVGSPRRNVVATTARHTSKPAVSTYGDARATSARRLPKSFLLVSSWPSHPDQRNAWGR